MIAIHQLEETDWPSVWRLIESVFRSGETFPQSPEISEAEARKGWLDEATATYVAKESGYAGNAVVGTYYIKPNQTALGSHVCNCGYIVGENARGKGGLAAV